MRPIRTRSWIWARAPQLLGVGLVTESYERHVGEALARLNTLLVVGTVCILGLAFGWTLSIRNRELRGRLGQERLRAEHLAELELTARGLAHETRNPLGLVRGLAQRINGNGDLPAEAREAAASHHGAGPIAPMPAWATSWPMPVPVHPG